MSFNFTRVLIALFLIGAGTVFGVLLVDHHQFNLPNLADPKFALVWSGMFGAALGGGFSYLGVRSSNISSLERLRVQHSQDSLEAIKQRSHDAKQKEEDRKAAIRREVYTKAAEEIHALLAAIGAISMKPLEVGGAGDADPLQAFLKANAKVWLVADSEAAHLSRDLTAQLGVLYQKALTSAYPLRLSMEPVWRINKQLVHAELEVQRITTKKAELKEENANQPLQEAIAQSLATASNFVGVLTAARQRILESLRPMRMTHSQDIFGEMKVAQQTIVKLVSALRKELHLSPDEDEFLAQHDELEKLAIDMLDRAYRGT